MSVAFAPIWKARFLLTGVLPLLLVFFVNVGMKLYELVAQGQ